MLLLRIKDFRICLNKRRVDYRKVNEIYHFGTKRHSGRYPYGSGDRPYQDREKLKAEKREKENLKKAGEFIRRAVWTGIAASLKVLASTAITSATLAGKGMNYIDQADIGMIKTRR